MANTPTDFMKRALALAAKGRFFVSPNPMVGCVVVKGDSLLAEGWHQQYGGPHAEVAALVAAGKAARGATLYINLEPCCHYGKTPPCVNTLIAAEIKKIYVACLDPNPLVAGKGVAALQQAGIEVEVGLCAEEAQTLNKIFFHYMKQQRPFVIAKWAMSLDGKTISHADDATKISGSNSLTDTHYTRTAVDAILVGANTVLADDPALTTRLTAFTEARQPIRIILTTQGGLPVTAKIFDPTLPGKTWIATTEAADRAWCDTMRARGIEVLVLPQNRHQKVSSPDLLAVLGERGISSLLVEGGMTVHHDFFRENLVDEVQVYVAPVVIADLPQKIRLPQVTLTELAPDFLVTARVEK